MVGSLALGYWTGSYASIVVFVSSGIALAALVNILGSYFLSVILLLEKMSGQISELHNKK